MRVYTVDLKEKYAFLQGGKLECILMDLPMDFPNPNWKRPAVIVVPGGGYAMVSKREGDPIASEFFANGFQAFVLTYEVSPNVAYPEQLLELSAAVDYVKANAEELNVNADEVFVVGFSAGGHLTANLAVEYQTSSQKAGMELNCKPTAVGLAYPVISNEYGHVGSHENLLVGYTEEARAELLKTLNVDKAVTKDTPPAFIWTTVQDSIVPCVNSLHYATALSKAGVEFELHIHPRGEHGAATGKLDINSYYPELANINGWIGECSRFFRMYTVEKM